MKQIDITANILAIHEREALKEYVKKAQDEFKQGIPVTLQSELEFLLASAMEDSKPENHNVLSFKPKAKNVTNFAETELLAASGKSLGSWFSQPLNFGNAGFILDVRKIIGTDNEVDLYLLPNTSDSNQMEKTLSLYKGQSIKIIISNDDDEILNAELYVDESGRAAEGSGKLMDPVKGIKGKISIAVSIIE
jgi:hypothetical protein